MMNSSVIARRAAPWQSMSLYDRPWIASFLAMTGLGRDDGTGTHDEQLRHCEARSAVAIHVVV
jgi:hypothetical protein